LAAGLVTCDHSLIALRPLAEMLVINASNIGTANCRSLDAYENFAVTGSRH
jgi:hypothetical protein